MRLLAFKREARFGFWDCRLVNPGFVGIQILTICLLTPALLQAPISPVFDY